MSNAHPTDDETGSVLAMVSIPMTAAAGHVTYYSGLLAGGLASSTLIGLALVVGVPWYALGGLVLGVAFAGSVAAIGSGRSVGSIGGGLGLLATIGAIAGLLVVARSGGSSLAGWLGGAGVLIGLGVARFRLAAFGAGAIARAIGWLLRVAAVSGVTGLFAIILRVDLTAIVAAVSPASGGGVAELLVPTTDAGTIAGFIVVAWLAVIGVWLVGVVLPPPSAVPAAFRAPYQRRTSQLIRLAGGLLGGGSVLAAVVYLFSTDTGTAVGLIEPTVGWIVGSSLLRVAFIRLFLTGVLLTVVIVIGRALGVDVLLGATSWSLAGAVLAVGLVVIAVLSAGPVIETLLDIVGGPTTMLEPLVVGIGATATGLLAGSLALLGLASALSIAPALAGSGLVPTATAGPRLVMSGLLIAAGAVALTDVTASVVFAVAIVAVVVWDIAVFGIDLTADLASAAPNRDGELVHAAASGAVGAIALAGTAILYRLITAVTVPTEGLPVAIVLAAIAVLLLSMMLTVVRRGQVNERLYPFQYLKRRF